MSEIRETPLTKPTLPKFNELASSFQEIFTSGILTNSNHVKNFEKIVQEKLKVPNAIALSSCTSGITLALKSLNLSGEVILPSFTFSATGHAVMWNGLTPRFVDVEDKHYCLDPELVKESINDKTSAILAVHMFGHPADVKQLQEIAQDHNLKIIFDAAHALGAKVGNEFVGSFGDAEIFSCSPTKLVVSVEGGILTTLNDELARKIRIGRNYGDDGSYDCEYPGLSARMSELHALVGAHSIKSVEENVRRRNELVSYYKKKLNCVDGISYQEVAYGATHTYKDFSILINPEEFGANRDVLHEKLAGKGIATRKYFYPPLHKMRAYKEYFEKFDNQLKITNLISENILCIPLFSHMDVDTVDKVVEEIKSVHYES